MEMGHKPRAILPTLIILSALMVTSVGVAVGTSYYRPWLTPSEEAVWAHGFKLPGSARDIQTVGNWRRGFLDRGASTVFVMDSSELSGFLTSLPQDNTLRTCLPGNGAYHKGLNKPWEPNQKHTIYNCRSNAGDWLHVRVYNISQEVAAVHLYTDWN